MSEVAFPIMENIDGLQENSENLREGSCTVFLYLEVEGIRMNAERRANFGPTILYLKFTQLIKRDDES